MSRPSRIREGKAGVARTGFRLFGALNRLCLKSATWGIALSATCILIVGVIGTVDVVSSAIFSKSVPAAVEISSYMMVFIVFGAFAYSQQRHEHVAVDMLVNALPPKVRYVCRLLSLLLGSAVFMLLTIRAWPLFSFSWEIRETAAAVYPFPVWPFKLGAFLLLLLATIEFLRQTILSICGREWLVKKDADEEVI